MSKRKVQEPVLTRSEVKRILEGINYGTLSRDELEHGCRVLGLEPEQDDNDADLAGYLQMLLEG